MRNEELVIGERYRIADIAHDSCLDRDTFLGQEVIFRKWNRANGTLMIQPVDAALCGVGQNPKRGVFKVSGWKHGGYYVTLEPITDPIPVLATPEEEAAWAEEDMKED